MIRRATEAAARLGTGGRFVLVGFGGFLVQAAALEALTRGAGLDYRAAALLAVEAAVLHNFVWHDRWTWASVGSSRGRLERALRFHASTAVVSIGGNVALMALFVGGFGWPVALANLLATLALAAANYRAADGWVFAPTTQTAEHQRAPARLPQAWRRIGRPLALTAGALALSASQAMASPDDRTVAAWDRYVRSTEQRIARELGDGRQFLALDFDAAHRTSDRARVLAGEILVSGDSIDVPSGLIHHWRGTAFIPGARLAPVLASVSDPTGPHAIRQEDVLDARVLSRQADGLRLFLKLQRRAIVSVAYNTEHDVRYRRHSDVRASSRSVATKIAELDDVGLPSERERPDGDDHGFLWRMHSYWRYEAVPGGVIVELESLTLSRSLPWGMRAVARPVIEHVARESIARTLTSLSERTRVASRMADEPAATGARPAAVRPPVTAPARREGAS